MRFLLLVGLALVSLQASVSAQECSTCGPRIDNSCAKRASDCGLCGLKSNPLSEKRYISQFCGPHIVPSSCFGYFKPNITPWGQACPMYGDAKTIAQESGPYKYSPAVAPAAKEPVKEMTKPEPKPSETTPGKPPVIPSKPPTVPSTLPKLEASQNLPDVTIPTIPVSTPGGF